MGRELTEGKPGKVLVRFSIPLFVSVIFQQLYNIADSMIAGVFAGEDALSAVGASYPITMIFMAVAVGSSIGCTVVISRFFGSGSYEKVKTASYTTLISGLVLSVVLTIAGLLTSEPLLRMLKTPDNIFEDGKLYLNIYVWGLTFLFIYNLVTGIFTSLGDSKTPLYFLIGSSLGNIVLDYIFVVFFYMGVAGVAWATFIAQGISCILAVITLFFRLKGLECVGKVPKFSFVMLKKIAAIAVPSILQQSFVSVGNIFIQGLVNGFGSSVIAGYSAAVKLNTFAITSFTTLANGLSTFTSQNLGAGKPERVKSGFRAGSLMALVVALPFLLVFFFGAEPMINAFIKDASEQAVTAGTEFFRIVSPFYFIICIKLMADGVLRGAGSMVCFMIATFSDLLLRVILAFVFASFMGSTGIWTSWPVGWTVAAILSVIFYLSGTWKKKYLKDTEPVSYTHLTLPTNSRV